MTPPLSGHEEARIREIATEETLRFARLLADEINAILLPAEALTGRDARACVNAALKAYREGADA